MDLKQVLDSECSGMSYNEALAHIQTKTVEADGMATSGNVLAYIASINKLGTIRDIAMDSVNPLRDVADATIVTLERREGFDFASPATVSLLQTFVTASVLTQEQADTIRSIGIKVVPAFQNVSMKDIVIANNPSTVVETISNVINDATPKRYHEVVVEVSNVPVTTHIVIQVRHKYNGTFDRWKHVTTLPNVKEDGFYSSRVDAEFFKVGSEFRAVCEYTANMSLTATVV